MAIINTTLSTPAISANQQPYKESAKHRYVGRFAPSPTGKLHLGSLVAAVACYLDARANSGACLLRIEDLDPPREERGASQSIIEALKFHGFEWDDTPLFQSNRSTAYDAAIQQLLDKELAYYCRCSRSQLAASKGIHTLNCNPRNEKLDNAAIRLRVPDTTWQFKDEIQSVCSQHSYEDVGDFVLKRKDGLYAYQLAVVVDDAFQQVTKIVRGADLLESTFRQQYLQSCLELPTPRYAHIPILLNDQGQKLSKQNHAPAIQNDLACHNLLTALTLLGQPTSKFSASQTCRGILNLASQQWDMSKIPHLATF
jgi:glutamyl-Q tRNA(Asp) synthetase